MVEKQKILKQEDKIIGPFSKIGDNIKNKTSQICEIFIDLNTQIIEIKEIKKVFLEFIIKSFEIQEQYSHNLKNIKAEKKGNEADPVTQADKEIEKIFRENFTNFTPKYSIAGEEDEIEIKDKSKLLLLDPIDGTSWFLNGIDKYGTVLGMYRNGYNILSIVLNTKQKKVYYADLKGQCIYNIIEKNGEFILKKETKKSQENLEEKNNIFLHLNFKGKNKNMNNEIKQKLEAAISNFNKKNNTNYNIVFMQTSVDTGVKVAKKQVGGFIHYGPAPHDIAGNLIYRIHNKDLKLTNHKGEEYNYFNHNDLVKSYEKYFEKKDTNGKEFLYKYPIIMTNNNDLHKLILNVISEYEELFNKKAKL